MLGFKKKNLIALALATAVVTASGFSVYRTQAAGKIDLGKDSTVSISVQTDETTNPFTDYKGYVTVRFYKVASIDATGQYTSVIDGVDLSSLSGSNVSASDTEKVADAAYKIFVTDSEDPAAGCESIVFTLGTSSEMTKILDKGLYLFVPQPTYDNIYDYTFKYSLVSVPTSKYITATKVDENGNIVSDDSASDDWEYNVDIILKPEATPRYGSLKISKTLETFNESLGKASFVFEVEATREDKIVFSNVYSMYFDSAKTKSVSVEHIPAGSTVTVKEVYSGASYTLESNSVITKEIVANNTVEANFTNDYDNRLIEGGIGIENHFIKSNEDGVDFEWDGSNIAATNDIQESEDE